MVIPIEAYDLVPRGDEVAHELVLVRAEIVAGGLNDGNRAETLGQSADADYVRVIATHDMIAAGYRIKLHEQPDASSCTWRSHAHRL